MLRMVIEQVCPEFGACSMARLAQFLEKVDGVEFAIQSGTVVKRILEVDFDPKASKKIDTVLTHYHVGEWIKIADVLQVH